MKIRKAKVFLLLGSVLLLAWKISANDDGVTVQTEDDAANDLSYESPYADPVKFYFADHFDDQEEFPSRWIKSQAKKDDTADEIAKYDGEWDVEFPKKPLLPNDLGLVLKSKAKHAAIASRLNRPFVFSDKPLIVQYEVNLQDGQECGGSYIKLLSSGKETTDLKQFRDKTPYTIMFGPDKCGNDIKLHFIFRHVNPMNGTITEKHCRKAKDRLDEPFKDKQPHLYQLVVRPDNTYTIRVDHKTVNEGSLFTEFMPPVNPPKEIDDPNDFKPENWDEREKIPDPDAKKPDDWNEDEPPQIPDPNASKPEEWLDDVEEMISDPNAEKPADWDVDMDGEWEAPLIVNPACEKVVGCGLWKAPVISNPNYKGKWRAPLIDNPNYQGKWAPRKIPNPDFFEDKSPFKMTTIAAIGIELWSMSSDILFDNLIIVDDETLARDWAAQTYDLKRKLIGREANTLWDRAMKYMGYKPGYWFAYFVYCSIPVIAYIWFLLKRRDKERLCDIIPNITIQNSVDSSAYYHVLMVSGCFEMQKYIDRIEAIQRKFVRYALRNLPWKDPVNLPPYEDRCQLLGLETLEQRRKNAKTVFVAKLLNAELDAPNLLALIDINIPGYSLRTAEFLRLPRWRQDYDGNEPVRAMMRNFNAVYNLYDFNETSIQFRSKLRRMN